LPNHPEPTMIKLIVSSGYGEPSPQRGLVGKIRRPKHNFTSRDLTRLLLTLWTQDNPIFIHERYRLQFTFAFQVFSLLAFRTSRRVLQCFPGLFDLL
jgi:hypothetical protein